MDSQFYPIVIVKYIINLQNVTCVSSYSYSWHILDILYQLFADTLIGLYPPLSTLYLLLTKPVMS